ncbi:hypothetical protein [Streptomyces aureus]|uniref:hypothetical protein n=1 Tax=Streptomyces aureus TaxID=193461 RepID=UPI00340C59CA
MRKQMLRSIASAFTHSGPSYHQSSLNSSQLEKTPLIAGLTHSGPSYETGMTRKIAPEESVKIAEDEIAPLLNSIRPTFKQIKEQLLGLDAADFHKTHSALENSHDLLRHLIELIEIDYLEASDRLRRGADPFDFRIHYTIWRQRRQLLDIAQDFRQLHVMTSDAIRALNEGRIKSTRTTETSSDLLPTIIPTVVAIFQRLDLTVS